MTVAFTRALVIGGGIGGMAAAIALSRMGIALDLVERGPEWRAYGTGMTITGPTMRAFRDLGILDAFSAQGFRTEGEKINRYDGTLLTELTKEPVAVGLPASGGIMRPKLHDIMADKVLSAGVDVRIGVVAEAIDQDDDGVTVRFSDGTSGRYDFVIASDGIYSDTRAMLFDHPAEPVYTGQMSWRVVAPRPPELTAAEFFFGSEVVGGIIPCSPTEVYAYILHPEPHPHRIPDDEKVEYLRAKMAHFGGAMGVIRDGMTEESSVVQRPFEYVIQPAPWHKGRVLLMGDAVHATTPHLASGAGMAVEDALVLADELGRADTVPAALAAFTARRADRCRHIVESSVAISRRQLEGASAGEIGQRMADALHKLAEPI